VTDQAKPPVTHALVPSPGDTGKTLAVARRLARSAQLPDSLCVALAGPLAAAVETAANFAGDSLAPATQRAYARDWQDFAQWCRTHGADPTALPIHAVLVAAYLASLVPRVGKSGLQARLAAIAYHHHRNGHAWVAGHPAIRATMRGILRQHGKPVRPAAALTAVEVKTLIATCGDDLAGTRDRAPLLVGLAGALRRSELVAIDHDRLRFSDAGLVVHILRSKRDQEGQGADVILPRMRGADTCPVQAMERWLQRAGITYGAVFRGVTAHGTLEARLGADGVRKILLRRAASPA
jgi:integrase